MVPTVIEVLRDISVIKVVSMGTSTVALDQFGLVYMWGVGGSAGGSLMNTGYGAGYGLHDQRLHLHPQLMETLPPGTKIADISCGLGHALFLTTRGEVYSSGSGGNGRLGLGDTSDRKQPCLITSILDEQVVSVQCGASHSLALTAKGTVYCWGKNTQGQCGLGRLDDVLKPALNKTLQGQQQHVVQVAAGWEHSLALTAEGVLYSWGSGYKDSRRGVIPPVLGLGDNEGRLTPDRVKSLDGIKIVDVTSGWDHCLALDSEGKALSWGSGQNGKLGHGNEEGVAVPCYIPALEGVKVAVIAAGCEHSAVVSETGILYTFGHGDGGRLGHGENSQCLTPSPVLALALMNVR
jgi:alpha-tubulin suppressor-like RCC1 family protein